MDEFSRIVIERALQRVEGIIPPDEAEIAAAHIVAIRRHAYACDDADIHKVHVRNGLIQLSELVRRAGRCGIAVHLELIARQLGGASADAVA